MLKKGAIALVAGAIGLLGGFGIAPSTAFASAYEFSATDYVVFDSQLSLGFAFTTNTAITITRLGYFDAGPVANSGYYAAFPAGAGDGLATRHEVGIFNSLGTLLTSTVLDAGTGDPLIGHFRYKSIAPITLAAGQSFTLAATTYGAFDPWAYGNGYGPGNSSTIYGFTVDPAITIAADAARYVYQGDNVLRDPLNHYNDYTVYAGPNFIAGGVPELSTWLMMIVGFGGVCMVRARRANPAIATS
jgi:hypothetical protein